MSLVCREGDPGMRFFERCSTFVHANMEALCRVIVLVWVPVELGTCFGPGARRRVVFGHVQRALRQPGRPLDMGRAAGPWPKSSASTTSWASKKHCRTKWKTSPLGCLGCRMSVRGEMPTGGRSLSHFLRQEQVGIAPQPNPLAGPRLENPGAVGVAADLPRIVTVATLHQEGRRQDVAGVQHPLEPRVGRRA